MQPLSDWAAYLSMSKPDTVIAAMERWSEEFIERPHQIVGTPPMQNSLCGCASNACSMRVDGSSAIRAFYTRRSPFPSFQVLSRELLKTASDSLLGSRYYDHFTAAMLKMVGMPRDDRLR